MKIKVKINEDELYPYFVISSETSNGFGKIINIPKELLDEYHLVTRKFFDIQEKIKKYYRNK